MLGAASATLGVRVRYELVPISEAAKRSGVSVATLRREAKRLPGTVKDGRRYLVRYPLPPELVQRVGQHSRSSLRGVPRRGELGSPETVRNLWEALRRRDADLHELVIAVANFSRQYADRHGKARTGTQADGAPSPPR
jgi:hypothetical protein